MRLGLADQAQQGDEGAGQGMGCRVQCLGEVGECGELRMKKSVLKLLPSATVLVAIAEAADQLRALCASGLFKVVGVLLRKQVESVTSGWRRWSLVVRPICQVQQDACSSAR